MKKKKIKIIAHGANSLAKIDKAFKDGADLVEVDVSKQVFTNRFVAQHQGIWGKFGIGQNLEEILVNIPQEKIIFDIKHPQFTPSFAEKFDALLKKFKFNNVIFASDNLEVLKKLANFEIYKLYFLVEDDKNLHKLAKLKNRWKGNSFGAIIVPKFLDRADFSKLTKDNLKIFVGPINNVDKFQKAAKIGVEGIITDEVEKMTKSLSGF